MSKIRFDMSMSLDGFSAGPSQSVEDPIGVGGMALFEWAFPLAAVFAAAGGTKTARAAAEAHRFGLALFVRDRRGHDDLVADDNGR